MTATDGPSGGDGPSLAGGRRLRVDPVACDGVGQCARVAPRLIALDRWGYPRLLNEPPERVDLPAAERAIRACPFRALWLQRLE